MHMNRARNHAASRKTSGPTAATVAVVCGQERASTLAGSLHECHLQRRRRKNLVDQRSVSGKRYRRSNARRIVRWPDLLQLTCALAGTAKEHTAPQCLERRWRQNVEGLESRRRAARWSSTPILWVHGRSGPAACPGSGHSGFQQYRHAQCETRNGPPSGASFDGGKTWPVKRLVYEGASGYSSLAAGRPDTASEGWIYLHFEGGPDGGSQVAQFNLSWLLAGKPTSDGLGPGGVFQMTTDRCRRRCCLPAPSNLFRFPCRPVRR